MKTDHTPAAAVAVPLDAPVGRTIDPDVWDRIQEAFDTDDGSCLCMKPINNDRGICMDCGCRINYHGNP